MLQRFLNPAMLAGISGLGLVAKTVVDGKREYRETIQAHLTDLRNRTQAAGMRRGRN
jgi:hypothetical protein